MLGKFSKLANAISFSNRTDKASAIILGDDGKFWVVTLAEMAKLEKAGYTVLTRGVAHQTIQLWIDRGWLEAVKIGGAWLIKADDLAAVEPPGVGRPATKK